MYTETLAHFGYRTASESNGERGVEAAFRLRPDAILMDIAMPGMNGIEATRRLREDARTCECLVVLATAYGMTMFDEARAAGSDAYFCKPFNPFALDLVLRTLSAPAELPALAVSPEVVKPEVVKRCSCGRELSRGQWRALTLCGRMRLPQRDAVVELRTCTCGLSLAVELANAGDGFPRPLPIEAVIVAEPAADPEPAVDAEPAPTRETLFVVDRDPHVRRLVRQFVGDAYAVEFFDDGYAALDRVRNSPPSAVITEVLVPRLDGLALCRLLKSDPVTEKVPVLVFSMLAADGRARESGADAFMGKPLEKERLLASLRSLTKSEASGPPQGETGT